jgi:predicted Zn finger-like uncharacterized protein
MALATQCPHCKTIFRVAQDQLKLRGGIVRCGACHEIFDGNASLVGMDTATAAPTEAPAAPPPAVAEAADTAAAPAAPAAAAPSVAGEEVPVYALDLGAALDPLGILPKPEAEADEHDAAVGVSAGQADEVAQPGDAGEDVRSDAPAQAEQALHAEVAQVDATASADAAVDVDEPVAEAGEAMHADELAEVGEAAPAEVPAVDDVGEPAEASAFTPPAAEPEVPMASHDERIEPSLGQMDEELVATVPNTDGDLDFGAAAAPAGFAHTGVDHAPLPQRESADGTAFAPPPPPPKSARARQLARRSKLTPTKIDAPKLRVPEIDEPEFVKRGRQREQSGKRRLILMTAGSVILLLALAVQAAVIFRDDLAARMPAMRPALVSLCAMLHCRVELPARIDNLTIETGELQTLAPDTYMLATLLHNQGSATQAWPAIELALTDATDKPLVRRVFTPADYLPKGAAAAGFGGHGEQAVKLYFQLDQLKPSGYHIAVFYP